VVAELVGNPRRPSVHFLVRRSSTSLARCAPSAFVGDLPRFQLKAAVLGALCSHRPLQACWLHRPCPEQALSSTPTALCAVPRRDQNVSLGVCLAGQGCSRRGTVPQDLHR